VLFGLFQPRAGTSLVLITERVARPICSVFRRHLPLIGPFDLSPAFAMLLLMLARLVMQWLTFELVAIR
jgi:uncharacterized protein YggT (Ycf19 family)